MILTERLIERVRKIAAKLLGVSEGVFYISGPETLPPPLTKAEEEEAFALLLTDTQKGREQLIVHNLRLVVYIAKKFESTGICVDDLVSIGTIGLIKAVNTFPPLKTSSLPPMHHGALKTRSLCFCAKPLSIKTTFLLMNR